MTVINAATGAFQKLLGLYENPILEYWRNKYADYVKDSMISEIFDMIHSSNATESITELIGAIQFHEWAGAFTYQDMMEGNTKVFTPIVWEAGRAFDRFTLSNAKILDLKNMADDFALGAARLRETVAAGMFTNADKTSFVVNGRTITNTTANGLALASESQTSANYTTNQSNHGHLVLNEANLETAIQAMVDFKDDNGNDCNLQPDTIIVPFANRTVALELIGGEGKYDVADNNPNIYNGSMRVIVWKQFRKQSGMTGQPWVVMDSQAAKKSFKWINRLESGEDHEVNSWKDEETLMWKLGSIMWWVSGMFDFRSCYWNIPA
jgi:phage major head subunit gpT-like protein